MEDSKSSRNGILVNSLKGSTICYDYLRSWFVGFVASNVEDVTHSLKTSIAGPQKEREISQMIENMRNNMETQLLCQ